MSRSNRILTPTSISTCRIYSYRPNFEPKDFEELAKTLDRVEGKFPMSQNEHPKVSRTIGGFKIQPVTLRDSVMRDTSFRGTTGGEVLISNYKCGSSNSQP